MVSRWRRSCSQENGGGELKPRVYVETSVIGHLTAWPQRDVIVLAHQIATQKWWESVFDRFELFVSELVIRECSAGDNQASRERLNVISELNLLPSTTESERLARVFIQRGVVPEAQFPDAFHIALAATHGLQFLATWNLRHIAGAVVRANIERVCREEGYSPPTICTPEELMEVNDA